LKDTLEKQNKKDVGIAIFLRNVRLRSSLTLLVCFLVFLILLFHVKLYVFLSFLTKEKCSSSGYFRSSLKFITGSNTKLKIRLNIFKQKKWKYELKGWKLKPQVDNNIVKNISRLFKKKISTFNFRQKWLLKLVTSNNKYK
jgi:hypothetical protein